MLRHSWAWWCRKWEKDTFAAGFLLAGLPFFWPLYVAVLVAMSVGDLGFLIAAKVREDRERKQKEFEDELEELDRLEAKEAERRRIAALPPPPTKAERAAAAKQRHDEKVKALEAAGLTGIELQAGQEKAKQVFLREIDGII